MVSGIVVGNHAVATQLLEEAVHGAGAGYANVMCLELIMRRLGLLFAMLFLSHASIAATLVTKNYVVSIESNCIEGEVTCDDVTYIGKSKRSGREIVLKGRTMHTHLPDGTPSRFVGYEFTHGNVVYMVSDSGLLRVTQGEKVLLIEQGEWDW